MAAAIHGDVQRAFQHQQMVFQIRTRRLRVFDAGTGVQLAGQHFPGQRAAGGETERRRKPALASTQTGCALSGTSGAKSSSTISISRDMVRP